MSLKQTLILDLQEFDVPVSSRPFFLVFLKHLLVTTIFVPAFACVLCYRLNRVIRQVWLLADLFSAWRIYTFANEISYQADIGPGFKIRHLAGIVIGGAVKIGSGCHVYNGVTIGAKSFTQTHLQPVIGAHARIGADAKILGPITLGDNVTVGALSFVDMDVPDDSIAYGNPMVVKLKNG